MTKLRFFLAALVATSAAFALSPAAAQRQEGTPEQRIDRLEKQLQQMQRQVFPKGRPADTAGFADDPAATQSSVAAIAQRLDSLERQMTDLIRMTEENANRQRTFETDLERSRTDFDRKLSELEQRLAAAAAAQPTRSPSLPANDSAQTAKPKTSTPLAASSGGPEGGSSKDPGEAAYSEGFKLWESGRYDDSITALRAFVSAYPKHRRVSFANNLVGRALLDKGEPRAAVPALIANYRSNPSGERAPDSLYYLGQALMKLGQPVQACNAYSELDEIYGAKVRPELKKLQAEAKQQAQCKS
ncbi:MAG: tetratricopeptide repeat protein [Sphingomicrobium sp.]